MKTIFRLIFLLLMANFVEAQPPAPSGFPSPYSTGYYRIGWVQTDSGLIDAVRDTTIRSRFAGLRFLWQHNGLDSSEWFFNGGKYIKSLNTQDTLAGRFLVTNSFLNSKGFLNNITGYLQQGTNVTISGSGTLLSPYIINSSAGGGGSVTNVATGYGLLGGPITTTGTLLVDTSTLSTYLLRRKDSSLYVTQTQLTIGLSTKQNTLTTGTNLQYFRGDLSLATFPTNLSSFTNGPGYITGNQSISFTASGDVTGTFTNPTVLTPTLTLKNTGIGAGSCTNCNVSIDAQGRVTNYANGSGGTGGTNSNIGTGYRWAVSGTNNIKTVFGGYGFLWDSTSNANALTGIVDTAILSGYWVRRKDSTLTFATPTQLSLKQNQLNGTGFVKATGTIISYDNSSYLPTTLNSANIFVGNGSNVATGVALTGAISITNTGVASLTSTITAGSCTNCNLTYNAAGQLTVASNGSGGSGNTNSNIGSGFRWAVPNTNNVKTFFSAAPLLLDSTTNSNALTIKADTSTAITGLTTLYQNSLKIGGTATSGLVSFGVGTNTIGSNNKFTFNTANAQLGTDTIVTAKSLSNIEKLTTQTITYPHCDSATNVGNSITVGTGATVNTQGYAYLFDIFLGLTPRNYAVSGSGVQTATSKIYANIAQNTTSFTTYMSGFNDIRRNAFPIKTYHKLINATKAAWVWQNLKTYQAAGLSGVTRTGTWSAPWGSNGDGGKGNGAYTSVAGDTIAWTTPSADTTLAFAVMGGDGSGGTYTDANIQVIIDGSVIETVVTNNQTDGISDGVFDGRRIQMAFYYKGLANTTHTIKLVHAGTTGQYMLVDWFGTFRDATTSRPFMYFEIPHMNAAGYATAPALATQALIDTANSKIDSLLATFPSNYSTYTAKTNTFYNTTTGLGPDNIHPNTLGHQQISTSGIFSLLNLPIYISNGGNGTKFYTSTGDYWGISNGLYRQFAFQDQILPNTDSVYLKNKYPYTSNTPENKAFSISYPSYMGKYISFPGGQIGSGFHAFDSLAGFGVNDAGVPQLYMRNPTAGTDSKNWDINVASNNMVFRILNDANTIGVGWLQVNRSNTAEIVNQVAFPFGDILIGTTVDVPSSLFTISSTAKGFLPPIMTLSQFTAIASKATSLHAILSDSSGRLALWNGSKIVTYATTDQLGGGGAVSSVANSDGTLTISPTTGAVVASLALGHANTWSALQTFGTLTTTGVTKFTGIAAGASTDSILTLNTSTGQVTWRSGASFNIYAANGLTAAGGDSIYLGGTLNHPTSLALGGFSLTFTGLPIATTATNTTALVRNATDSSLAQMALRAGTYTSTFTNTTNVTTSSFTSATYTVVGKIVHVVVSGTITPTASLSNSVLTMTLPFTGSTSTTTNIGVGSISPNGTGVLYVAGLATMASSTTATFQFYYIGTTTTSNFAVSFDYSL